MRDGIKEAKRDGITAEAARPESKGRIRKTFGKWKDSAALAAVAVALALGVSACSFDKSALKMDAEAGPNCAYVLNDAGENECTPKDSCESRAVAASDGGATVQCLPRLQSDGGANPDAVQADGGSNDGKLEDGPIPDGGDATVPDGGQEDAEQSDAQVQEDAGTVTWNPAWQHCRDIAITKQSAETIPGDYPHGVDVQQLGDPNLRSLRAVRGTCASNATDFQPIWIESTDGAGSGRFWTVINQTDALGFAIIYGNPSAPDVSNGDAVFPLFDSFSGSALDTMKWTCRTSCTQAGGELTVTNSNPSIYPAVSSTKTFGTGYSFNALLTLEGQAAASSYDIQFGFSNVSPSTPYVLWIYDGPSDKYALEFSTAELASARSATDNGPHAWRIDRNQASAAYHYDGSLLYTMSDQYPTGDYPVVLYTTVGVMLKADWLYVRPKLESEPLYDVGPQQP